MNANAGGVGAKAARDELFLLSEVMHYARESFAIAEAGRFLFVNASFARLFGADRSEEVEGRPVSDFLPAAQPCASPEVGSECSASACHFRAKVGERAGVRIAISCHPLQIGQRTLLVMNATAQHPERLHAEQERLVPLFDAAGLGVAQCSLDGRIVHSNVSFERLFGVPAGVQGKHIFELAPPPDVEQATKLLVALLSGQRYFLQFEAEVPSSPFFKTVRLSASVNRTSDHKPDSALILAEDTTPQRRMEQELRLAQKFETMGRVTGGVAHDFNNLLTGITLYADLMLAEVPAGSSAHHHAASIRDAAEKGGALVHQLMGIVRHDIKGLQRVSLNHVVVGLADMLSRLVGENILLQSCLADDLWPVLIDPAHGQQVLLNLVLNARDSMPQGGRILIETGNFQSAGSAAPEFGVELAVSDSGCGMAPDTLRRAFEPFFTTKSDGRGSGLGLSTVRRIVEQARGAIDVQSRPGAGTRVTIRLPRLAAPSIHTLPASPHAGSPPSPQSREVNPDFAVTRARL